MTEITETDKIKLKCYTGTKSDTTLQPALTSAQVKNTNTNY